ncbi:MAG TPA: DUF4236 domain-containing protein [Longimicrobium sp.]|jgi:hypothetical protein
MGFRFRKSIKILPGVRVNVSRSGVSTTIGGRGASVSIGKRGSYLNTGIPGTGLSYRERIGGGSGAAASGGGAANGSGAGCLASIGALFTLIVMATCVGSGPSTTPSYSPPLSVYDTSTPTTDELYIHESLNVRTDPNRGSSKVRTLARGTVVLLGPKDANGWAPLYDSAGQREGYVYRASDAVRSYPAPQRPAKVRESSRRRSSASTRSSAESRGYYTGPRGGCYTYSASGRKRYVDHSNCN